MKLTTLTTLFLLVFSNVTLAQSKKEPFDFKGIRLGITQDEFMQLPVPATSEPINSIDTVMPAKPVCTNTESSTAKVSVYASLSNAEKQLGIVNCEYSYTIITGANSPYPLIQHRIAEVLVGDYYSKSNTFSFIKSSSGDALVLYRINFTLHSKSFDSVDFGLRERFGKPKTTNQVVQNRVGGVFNNTIEQWDNPLSAIVLERYSYDLNTSGLVYFLKKENALVRKIETEAKKNSM